jgi:hypothetical protein
MSTFRHKNPAAKLRAILGGLLLFLGFSRQLKLLTCLMLGSGMVGAGLDHASAQSIGFNFTTNSTWVGLYDNGESNSSLAPTSVAGFVPQAYWNNVGYKGSVNPGVVTNSVGNPVSLNLQWNSAYAFSAYDTSAPYGTPDGQLMNGFIGTDNPSAPTNALGTSVSNSPGTDVPLIYVSGLNAWLTNAGALGYQIVVYTTGWSSYEVSGYWIQSVTGSPFNNTMSGGAALTSTNWLQDSASYNGTYVPITSTSSNSPTGGANYMESGTLTNDAVLIRSCCLTSYGGVGINGFQIIPVFPPITNATVIINATNALSTVNPAAYGIFMAVWESFSSATVTQAVQSGATAMRYPGGGYSDNYHWSAYSGLNDVEGTPFDGTNGDAGYYSGSSTLPDFISLMTNAQQQAVFTVDWGSGFLESSTNLASSTNQMLVPNTNGSPLEAAAWVAYCNASTNIYGTTNDVTLGMDSETNNWHTAGFWAMIRAGSPLAQNDGYNFLRIKRVAPLGVKYWEIGNEPYGNGYYGGGNGYESDYAVPYPYTVHPRATNALLSPWAYGNSVKAFSIAMKAVDPTIKIGAYVVPPPATWDYINGISNSLPWTQLVLAQCGSNVDFLIQHWYPTPTENSGTNLLSQVSTDIAEWFNGTGGGNTGPNAGLTFLISNYCPNPSSIQLAVTEFAANNSPYITNNIGTMPILGPVEALFTADSYSTWLTYPCFANADWTDWDVDSFRGSGSNGPVVYAYQMLRHWANSGDTIVKSTSNISNLRVGGSVQQDGKMGILLINESINSSRLVYVTVTNANLSTTGTIYQFGTNNWSGTYQYTNEVPSSGPTTNSISGVGNTFSVTLPAYTMDVLVIPIISNTPPVLAAISNQTVNVGQTVALTASSTDANQPPQTLTFALLAGATNATLNTSSGAFSFRPLVTQANTSNNFTLQVSDNGTPSLSATQGFAVVVNPLSAPAVSSVSVAGGQFSFSVGGQSGPDYAIESSTNLVQWSNVFITNSPALPFNWTATATNDPQRFYRIKLGPPLP